MTTQDSRQPVLDALNIPYISVDEVYGLPQTELRRFLGLLDTLEPNDWTQPTACTQWNVRDVGILLQK